MEPPSQSIQPIQPIQLIQSEENGNSNKLTEIIKILTKYKTNIVNQETLNDQAPANAIRNLTVILKKRAGDLKEYLNTRKSNISDPNFEETVAALQSLINPWTPEISILTKDYVHKLFIESSPLSFKMGGYLEKNASAY